MITTKPKPLRFHKRATTPTAPLHALMLVSATYAPGAWVDLTFDRAIDIAGLDAAEFFVDDAPTTHVYQGEAATLLTPTRVRVTVGEAGDYDRPGVHLDAGAGNGIVAAGDGAAWAGATGLALPFG